MSAEITEEFQSGQCALSALNSLSNREDNGVSSQSLRLYLCCCLEARVNTLDQWLVWKGYQCLIIHSVFTIRS